MKSIRYPLIAVIAIFIILLGFGSSMDLEIAKGIYASEGFARGFGIVMAALSMFLAYAIYPVFGGVLFQLTIKNDFKKWVKALFIFVAVGAFAFAVTYSGREVWGVHGFNKPELKWLGYVIAVPVNFLFALLGWFIGSKIDNKDIWKVGIVVLVAVVISMVVGTAIFKVIFHRPRYRFLVREEFMGFMPWWKPCSNYKELLERFSAEASYITKEEWKSFPSGHAGFSCTLMIMTAFLPLLGRKAAKCQLPAFIAAFIWTLLVGLSRMIVGAHYLSDVAMGCIINLLCFFAANEFLIRDKRMQAIIENQLEK